MAEPEATDEHRPGDADRSEAEPAPADEPEPGAPPEVLAALGIDGRALLGEGGEAWVYRLDAERIVRVLRIPPSGAAAPATTTPGAELGPDPSDPATNAPSAPSTTTPSAELVRRGQLCDELRQGSAPFRLPELLDRGRAADHEYAVERWLPGRPVADELARLDRADRSRLIEAHLDAAAALGRLPLEPRPWFGDLIAAEPIRAPTWREFSVAKVAASVARAPGFEAIDAVALATDLPAYDEPHGRFVHLDAFSGNMLAAGSAITAVIDLGSTTIAGDPTLDPVTAAVYLCAEPITPAADREDRAVAAAWLRDAGLTTHVEPVRRWIAGYWAWATDDAALHRWCRSVLL